MKGFRPLSFCLVLASFLWIAATGSAQTTNAYVVTNTGDDGTLNSGSLRDAINQSNANGGGVITFDSTVFGTAQQAITVTDPSGVLPEIKGNLTITAPAVGVQVITTTAPTGGDGLMHVNQVAVTLSGLFINSNTYGIQVNDGSLTATNCTFTAGVNGIQNSGSVTAINCTFSGCGSDGIFHNGATTAINCTFNGNNVGLIDETNIGAANLINCTFCNNSRGVIVLGFVSAVNCTFCSNEIGIFMTSLGSNVTVQNCVVAGNSRDLYKPSPPGTVTADSSNIIGTATGTVVPGAAAAAGLQVDSNGNPVLQYNGGPTQTVALVAGGMAIDHGNNSYIPAGITTDQRGFGPRAVNGTVDAGAYEYGAVSPLVVNTTADSTDTNSTVVSLRDAINYANSLTDGLTHAITFDPSVFGATQQTITVTDPSGVLPAITGNLTITAPPVGVQVTTTTAPTSQGLMTLSSGTASLSGLSMTSNQACIYNNNATLTATDAVFTGVGGMANGAGTGPTRFCIFNSSGTVTVTACTFTSNPPQSCGGITSDNGNGQSSFTTVTNSTFTETIYALEFNGGANATVTGCTFTGNIVAVLILDSRNLGFTNCTFWGNRQAIYDSSTTNSFLTITNCTISENDRAVDLESGSMTLQNSLVVGNNVDIVGASPAGDASTNIIGTANSGVVPGEAAAAGLQVDSIGDTLLRNNGGPTQTIALGAGGAAINRGNNSYIPAGITTDQRGFGPRIINGTVDAGAYEYGALGPLSVTSMTGNLNGNAQTITITGTGFDSLNLGNNLVTFNDGAVGVVTGATATTLTVAITTAPTQSGPLTASVTVTTDGDSTAEPVEVANVVATCTLGTSSLLEGPAAGIDSVTLTVAPVSGTWSAMVDPNSPWLHVATTGGPANDADGTGSINAMFTFDQNTGATRTGTITLGGQTLTVTQAGSSYVAAQPVTTLVSSGLSHPTGVAVDGSGNVYIADYSNNAIKKWTAATGNVTPLVSDGLSNPKGVAVDTLGNVYIADTGNSAIKKWTAATGNVTTLVSGLGLPVGVAVDTAGNIYFADAYNIVIGKWTAATGNVTTLAYEGGLPVGVAVDASGNVYFADTNSGALKKWTAATGNITTLVSDGLNHPFGVAVDASGNVYIADSFNNAIKKWTAATGTVSTLVSDGLGVPLGVTVDASGNVYIADTDNSAIEELPYAFVDPTAKTESAAAGSDSLPVVLPSVDNLTGLFAPTSDQNWLSVGSVSNGVVNFSFTANSTGATRTAHLTVLGQSIAVTQGVSVTVTSSTASLAGNAGTLVINGSGFDATTPGNNVVTFSDGAVGVVTAVTDTSLTVALTTPPNATGELDATVSVDGNSTSTAMEVANVTQTYTLAASSLVEGPGQGTDSVLLTVAPASGIWTAVTNSAWLHVSPGNASGTGSTNVVFSFDANAGATRTGTITLGGQTLTVTQAGSSYVAAQPLTTLVSGLDEPFGVAVDGSGNVYFADSGNSEIKMWTATTGKVSTLVPAGLFSPQGVAVDASGNVYFADSFRNTIQKWTAATNTVSPLASSGLNKPYGVAVDTAGNVYFADSNNNAIKMWTAATGNVTTLVSDGLNNPQGVAVDASGNVYIADTFNNVIKKWTAATGNVTTLVSDGLKLPFAVVVDASGNFYIADTFNNAIKKWTAATGTISTLVSSGLHSPQGVTVDASGNVYIADTGNSAIEELPYAFVDPTVKTETAAAGSDSLPVVLPSAESLMGPFAPTSDQSWLTVGSVSNGVVNFSFTANTSAAPRSAHLTVLGQKIAVTQAADAASSLTTGPGESTTVGTGFGSSETVTVLDANGKPIIGETVTLSGPATGAGATFPNGNTAVTDANGVATFSFNANNTAGSYQLTASVGGVALGNSSSATFTNVAGAPAKLVILQQPGDTVAGQGFTPAVRAQILDQYGNPAPSAATVTAAIGNNPGGSILSGTPSQTTSNGLASFGGLSLNKVGSGYTLVFTSSGLPSVTSTSFSVAPGAASQFVVTATTPTNGGAADSFTVTALDSFGNTVTNFTDTVSFTSTDPAAILPGSSTLTHGTGTFNVTFNSVGSQTVTATDTAHSSVTGTSNNVTVSSPISISATVATTTIGGTPGSYTISRSGTSGNLVVNFQLDGASTANSPEFTLSSSSAFSFNASAGTGSVTIPDGANSATVTLTATANSSGMARPDQTVQLDLENNGSSYSISASGANATVTIKENGLVVFNANDSGLGSLRQAISNAGDLGGEPVVTFDPASFATPQTITLSGTLALNFDITINGPGANLVTVSGNHNAGVFTTGSHGAHVNNTLSGLTIANGSSSGDGGGILFQSDHSLVLNFCVLSGNTAKGNGGGLCSSLGGNVTVNNCTFSNNSAAPGSGGGIANNSGTLAVNNSTFAGNQASLSGGGIFNASACTATLNNVTLSKNVALQGGGIATDPTTREVALGNTLVAGNTASVSDPDVSGAYFSLGGNLIAVVKNATGCINGLLFDQTGTSTRPLNPQLGPLQNNGGPTPTMALANNSTAIGAGLCTNIPGDPRTQYVTVVSLAGTFTLTYNGQTTAALARNATGAQVAAALNGLSSIGGVGGSVSVSVWGQTILGEVYIVNFGGTLANNSVMMTGVGNVLTLVGITSPPVANDQRGPGFPRVFGSSVDIGAFEFTLPPVVTPSTKTMLTTDTTLTIYGNYFDGTPANGTVTFTNSGVTGTVTAACSTSLTVSISGQQPGALYAVVSAPTGSSGKPVQVAQVISPVTHFSVSAPSTDVGGTPFTIKVTALDCNNAVVTGYTGSVSFTSSDNGKGAAVPSTYTFTASDGGSHTFTNGVTLVTAGNEKVSAADTTLSYATGSASILVGTTTPTATQVGTATLNRQTGLYQLVVNVSNTTPASIKGFTLHVNYKAYLSACPSLSLSNASSAQGASDVYVNNPSTLAVGATAPVTLQFFTTSRTFPSPFSPIYTVEVLTN